MSSLPSQSGKTAPTSWWVPKFEPRQARMEYWDTPLAAKIHVSAWWVPKAQACLGPGTQLAPGWLGFAQVVLCLGGFQVSSLVRGISLIRKDGNTSWLLKKNMYPYFQDLLYLRVHIILYLYAKSVFMLHR